GAHRARHVPRRAGGADDQAAGADARRVARHPLRRGGPRRSARGSRARAHALRVIRVTYELDPPEAAETLALIESVGRAAGPEHVRGRVVVREAGRAVLEFPEKNWGGDVTLLVSSLLAGEWADSAAFTRCRLVELELPAGLLPG